MNDNVHMAPFEIRNQLISDLKATRLAFFRAETAIDLDSMSPAQRQKAGQTLVEVNIAITKLETLELKSIAADLKAISGDLISASDQLRDAVDDFENFKVVMDRAGKALRLLEKAADLAGIVL